VFASSESGLKYIHILKSKVHKKQVIFELLDIMNKLGKHYDINHQK